MTEDNINITSKSDDSRYIYRPLLRQQTLFQAIAKTMRPITNIYKVGFYQDDRHKEYSYVVIIKKDPKKNFIQRVIEFEQCLRENLIADERLYYENRCFIIRTASVSINYCLEGYAKQSDRIGYCEYNANDSKAMTASEIFTHRMPTYVAFKWIRKHCTREDIIVRANLQKMKDDYPNPADRFIASVRIEKQLKKSPKDKI